MLVVVSGDEDWASLEEVAPACGADVIRIEELQDVPRALERLVITLTRGRSGQYTASGPARVHADRDDGWHPPLPESPAPAPVASPKDPDAAQAVPARARISNVALFKDDDLRSVRGGLTGDPDAELVITLEEPGKVLVARDRQGQTLRIEGVMTVKKGGLGEVRFVGDVDLDTSGVTPIRGTLVFDLAKSVSIKVRGQVHPRTHKARAGTKVALVF
jgi:hypothetical protein